MIPYMPVQALTNEEITKIHAGVISILQNTGLVVEHPRFREIYAEVGAHVDSYSQIVKIPEIVINRFLGESDQAHPPTEGATWLDRECYRPICPGGKPSISTRSGVSLGDYLEPGTNDILPFTEETLAEYIQLAHSLDNGIVIRLETLPVGQARRTQPLEGRLFAWKHGAEEGGSIQMTALCPYIFEMCEIRADALGAELEDVFCASVYIISPLRLPYDICEQILFFHERGLRVRIGNMFSIGGSGPVTLAGCLALGIAECIAVGIINRALYGDKFWILYGEIAPLDMRTMVMLLGRPEMLLLNLAIIQLAGHYHVPAHPLGGISDAILPSTEAGMQKVLSALPCILAGGCNIDAGRLGIDSLYSPIQMILDSELISAIRRILRGFEINQETLAIDLISEVGAGGLFIPTMHTAKHMRSELWQSKIWSRENIQSWLAGGAKTDADRAFDLWKELMSMEKPSERLSEGTQHSLQAVIDRASQEI